METCSDAASYLTRPLIGFELQYSYATTTNILVFYWSLSIASCVLIASDVDGKRLCEGTPNDEVMRFEQSEMIWLQLL